MNPFVVGILAAVAGAVLMWVVRDLRAKAAHATFDAKVRSLEDQLAAKTSEHDRLREAHDGLAVKLQAEAERRATAEAIAARVPELDGKLANRDAVIQDQKAQLAEVETRIAEERKAAQEKLKLIGDAEAALTNAFKALSSDALKQNNQSFVQLATATLAKFQETAKGDLEARQKAVDAMVLPIRESLQKVDGKLGEIEKSRLSAYSALTDQLKNLVETHIPMLRNETGNLVKALRQPIVRGRWGEIQLRRVVEMAGMLDHCDFLEQESVTTEDGRLRPDLIVKLPGGKQIVVDAKAPVAAYLDAVEIADDEVRLLKLNDHARQVRDHMVSLGRKAYWEQFDPSPELVILFLPGEMFFSAALQQDPGLIEFGVNERVIPATPTTLISLLRAVHYGWRQEALAANAQEVALLGKQLYERITTLADHWTDVGQRLGKAVESYNKSVTTLESRVLVSARRFRELRTVAADADIPMLEQVEVMPAGLQSLAAADKEGGKS